MQNDSIDPDTIHAKHDELDQLIVDGHIEAGRLVIETADGNELEVTADGDRLRLD